MTTGVLNAEFAVELDGPGLAVVLESAGGTSSTGPSRNSDYIPSLELILARLQTLGAVLVSGVVDSRKTEHLPESERTVLDRPLRLSVVDDLAALRLQLTSRQGRIGQAPNAPKAGNNRKRLRLRVEVPGYGPTDALRLATEIARPIAAPASLESATELPAQRRSGEPGSVRLNEWWQDDPAECYWLEITDRNDIGANVQALQRDGSGRENWSYALVTRFGRETSSCTGTRRSTRCPPSSATPEPSTVPLTTSWFGRPEARMARADPPTRCRSRPGGTS
ncbi:hypothetical protein [Micromonospora sp. NPDC005205]|uniref:hypothetical protein n=1 Tax=Micromonospora sp. NPDC005205 TaxID=3156714 RepID=UPI0033A0BD51